MIKDIFKLRKTAWHAKLMKFTWGYNSHDFPNMCPYFWLSVFNVLFILPIIAVKLFKLLIYWISMVTKEASRAIDKSCESKSAIWVRSKLGGLWLDDNLIKKVFAASFNYNNNTKYYTLYSTLSDEERSKLHARYYVLMEEQRKKDELNEAIQYKAELRRTAKIGKATVIIKKVFNIIIWPVLVFAIYMIYQLVLQAMTWDYTWIWRMGYVIYVIIGSVIGCLLVLHSIFIFMSWIKCKLRGQCIPCENRQRKLSKFWWIITRPFALIGLFFTSIYNGLVMIKDIIVAFRQNNCPSIEWEE